PVVLVPANLGTPPMVSTPERKILPGQFAPSAPMLTAPSVAASRSPGLPLPGVGPLICHRSVSARSVVAEAPAVVVAKRIEGGVPEPVTFPAASRRLLPT